MTMFVSAIMALQTESNFAKQYAEGMNKKDYWEPVFDDASFGYRKGRSTKDALRKIWKELEAGAEWIVDGDLKDFFELAS